MSTPESDAGHVRPDARQRAGQALRVPSPMGLMQGYIDELTAGGMSLSDARNAAQIAAPLHNPDQVWGNSVVDALGDPNVNSSIGGGAPSRVAQLKNMLSGDKQSKDDKLNIKLCAELDGKEVC